MPNFTFKARRANGEEYKGSRDAKDKYELYKLVKEDGADVMSVSEHTGASSLSRMSFSFGSGVGTQEKIIFTRNLGSMLEAGLAVSRALSVMERQAQNKKLKSIIAAINNEISQGKTLSDALLLYPKVFSSLLISMVKAGEQSGTLAAALKLVALQMDRTYSLQRKVRGALMYPGIILGVMVIIAILMLTYIVPTLTSTFRELNVQLPATTRFVVWMSDLLINSGLWVLVGLALVGFLTYLWSKSLGGKKVLDLCILKIPVIGGIVREVNTARTARTLSSLLTSGVDVVEAVHITGDVLQNFYYRRVLIETEEKIKKGSPMSDFFMQNTTLYPIFLAEMMNVGEETGKMGEMLLGVAEYFEEDVEQRTKDMSTIIEPFLMVIIGAAVGFFALSMISPMYSLVNVI